MATRRRRIEREGGNGAGKDEGEGNVGHEGRIRDERREERSEGGRITTEEM